MRIYFRDRANVGILRCANSNVRFHDGPRTRVEIHCVFPPSRRIWLADKSTHKGGEYMRKFAVLTFTLAFVIAAGVVLAQQQSAPLSPWAYGFDSPAPPAGALPRSGGSSRRRWRRRSAAGPGYDSTQTRRQHSLLHRGANTRWVWTSGLVSRRSSSDAGNRSQGPRETLRSMRAVSATTPMEKAGRKMPACRVCRFPTSSRP